MYDITVYDFHFRIRVDNCVKTSRTETFDSVDYKIKVCQQNFHSVVSIVKCRNGFTSECLRMCEILEG